MESLELPIKFAKTLEGSTCFVSRVRKNIELNAEYPLFTLHQIVYKILRKGERSNYYTNRLSGGLTYKNIKHAITSISGYGVTDSHINDIYHKIRAHKNTNRNLIHTPNGIEYLSKYQSLLGDEMDWEDSMHTATWMLKQAIVSSLHKFPYQNIILVKPELLGDPRNNSSKEFFLAWCEWISHYTTWNIYIFNQRGTVYQYINNQYKIIRSDLLKDRCFSFNR